VPRAVRIATCQPLPEPDVDAEPLAAAFVAAGITATWLPWHDPSVPWRDSGPTVIRSTWDYAGRLPAFLTWCDEVSAAGALCNPADVVRRNVHKRYLVDLAARGVAVTPTTIVDRGDLGELASKLEGQRGSGKLVVKPAVAAASRGSRVFAANEVREALAHATLLLSQEDILIQPYLASVEDYGERSLVWIDGEISHAIRKAPRWADASESISGPMDIASDERALATQALAPFADRIQYGRVDMARRADGQPVVMELELIEPSLFFARCPGSADRYVAGIARHLSTVGAWT